MSEKIIVWRVRIGKLYYVQGLHRYIKENSLEYKNIEMTSYKEAAFLFLYVEIAEKLAKEIEGIVEKVELVKGEYSKLDEIHEYHCNSENDWNYYANIGMLKAIK